MNDGGRLTLANCFMFGNAKYNLRINREIKKNTECWFTSIRKTELDGVYAVLKSK